MLRPVLITNSILISIVVNDFIYVTILAIAFTNLKFEVSMEFIMEFIWVSMS